jgi:hypothetical protein
VVRQSPTGDGGYELVTRHAGLPVDAGRLGSADALRAAAAGLATVLAGLHERGVAHGAVVAEHVLVGRGGTVSLCGLATGDGDPADDLQQLGLLLSALGAALPPGPDDRADLVALAGALADAQPSRRPTARRVATSLAPSRAPDGRRETRSRRPAAAIAGVLAVLLLAVLLVRRPAEVPSRTDATQPPSTSTATTLVPAPCAATAGRPVDAATCGADASVEGAVVAVAGRRAVVGRTGDEVVVADWGCEGELRPAVLRPATGEVLVLAALREGGAPVVERAERVEGASALRAALDAAGCAALFAVTDEGAVRVT